MAVTATANSEQLAVASLITYDVYRTYINPKVGGLSRIETRTNKNSVHSST